MKQKNQNKNTAKSMALYYLNYNIPSMTTVRHLDLIY